jgi:hypothetical protein
LSEITLPRSPEADILTRLIRARQFLEHAKLHAASGTEFDYMIATHGADNAVEFTLKLIADHVRYEEVSGSTLPETELAKIAGDLSKFLREKHGVPLPYFQEIKALRQTRNLVQHGSFTPGSDVNRLITIADKFFARVCNCIFGLDSNQLCVASVVTDTIIQRHLHVAENALNSEQFEECVRACRNGFEESLFKYCDNSSNATMAIPARVSLAKIGSEVERYVTRVSDNLDLLKLKIDSNRLDRFNYITEHLSTEPNGKRYGYRVMQRSWEKADAEFCYGFVAENVLRWQSDELSPFYTPSVPFQRKVEESINGISLSGGEKELVYLDNEMKHEIYRVYVPPEIRDQLETLKIGMIYRWISKHYQNDVLETEISSQVRLNFFRSELTTHDPERWRIVLDKSREPFSFHRCNYLDGKLISETPCLQECTEEDLILLSPVDSNAAKLILAARDRHGFLNAEVFRQIKGLSQEQVEWIEYFIRI